MRTLDPAPSTDLVLRLTDGQVEMGLHPVMYGWRVRAGFCGNDGEEAQVYECDWCCGDNPMLIWGTYCLMKRLLESGMGLMTLPKVSAVKPWPKDDKFRARVIALAESIGVGPNQDESWIGDVPDFNRLRIDYFQRYINQ